MNRERTVLLLVILALLILVPRYHFLGLGLDARRLADTNVVPTTLDFLSHASKRTLGDFYRDDHKYPLLGAYLLAPPVAVYYAYERAAGVYQSPQDFLEAYVLRETNLYLFVQWYMMLVNILSIALFAFVAYRFTVGSKEKAGLLALLFAGISPYLLFFSVTPRIHSFAFLFGVVALWASLWLLRNKSLGAYLSAFGAAALCVSIGQNGIPALILPIAAHFFDAGRGAFTLRGRFLDAKLFYGLFFAFALGLIIGYPSLLANFLSGDSLTQGLISGKHPTPIPSLDGVWLLFGHIFIDAEIAATWLIACALILWIWRRFSPDAEEKLALFHVAAYLAVFAPIGWIVSGYFSIAVLPSVFFLGVRFSLRLAQQKVVRIVLCGLVLVQLLGIVLYTKAARGGDTVDQASSYLLSHSTADETILGSFDHHMLAIAREPGDIPEDAVGTDAVVREHSLTGSHTRNFQLRTNLESISLQELREYDWVLIEDWSDSEILRKNLREAGFAEAIAFISHAPSVPFNPELFTSPTVLRLHELFATYRSGPSITIYRRD